MLSGFFGIKKRKANYTIYYNKNNAYIIFWIELFDIGKRKIKVLEDIVTRSCLEDTFIEFEIRIINQLSSLHSQSTRIEMK